MTPQQCLIYGAYARAYAKVASGARLDDDDFPAASTEPAIYAQVAIAVAQGAVDAHDERPICGVAVLLQQVQQVTGDMTRVDGTT